TLRDHGLSLPLLEDGDVDLTRPGGQVVVAPLERGFILPNAKLAVVAECDVTGRRRAHRAPRVRRTDAQAFFEDLQPGDYVVHHQHGVARYGGMVKRAIGGAERDYLLLEYKGGDKLYVPSDQIDAVRHYTGGETPTLHRLGGSEWQRTKSRVRAAVRQIAQELVVLYRRRVTSEGHAFAPDTPWQHFQTFSERFAGYPVRVEVLSRFLTPAQSRKVVQGLADGEVDVVIGTHRLLSGDIRFKDLGLLVVDEEQRFGVTHKENIKKLKVDVDVLTLTATPT